MKIGVLLTGISYDLGRDYNHCAPIIYKNLIDPLRINNDVDIYLTSYNHSQNQNLIGIYKPTLYQFDNYSDSHQVLTYIKALEQIRDQDLDFVICTRFDIHFHKNISTIGLDFSKFNALFKEKGWWDNMKFTTDNFFAFPYSMLDSVILALHSLYFNPSRITCMDLHQLFFRVQNQVGITNTKIISNIDELSNYNSFYSLCNTKWGICESH